MTCFAFAMCSCRGLLHWKSWILFMEMKWHFKCFSWNCRTSSTNHTTETQSNCRDHQWFQDGYNKGNYHYLVLGLTAWWLRDTVKSICCNKIWSAEHISSPQLLLRWIAPCHPWVNHFPPDNTNGFLKTYPMDSPIPCLNNCTVLWVPFSFNMRLQTNSKLKSCMLYTPGSSCSAKAD